MSLKYVYRKKLLSFDLSKIPVFDKKNHNVTPIDFMAIISSSKIQNFGGCNLADYMYYYA